ncbi:MAG TPA: hypothetical protein VJB87_01785 [Candidatus Nanoarchaeia archaeon]|nr:hypothetical protein [Candidatus Nanoarchaeia archaeon]
MKTLTDILAQYQHGELLREGSVSGNYTRLERELAILTPEERTEILNDLQGTHRALTEQWNNYCVHLLVYSTGGFLAGYFGIRSAIDVAQSLTVTGTSRPEQVAVTLSLIGISVFGIYRTVQRVLEQNKITKFQDHLDTVQDKILDAQEKEDTIDSIFGGKT